MSPVFSLTEELIFPHPTLREPNGLLAVGGTLHPQMVLLAYRWGIFPWFHEGQPILWWWIVPRLMVRPQEVHISHSLRNTINRKKYHVTIDQNFEEVIKGCAENPRPGQHGGTWILPEMIQAYIELFKMGIAHSIEVHDENGLAGGLYGIALGRIFFGESMFSVEKDASKIGFIHLANHLASRGFEWIDCQQDTPHMRSLGADLIGEEEFLQILRNNQFVMLQADDAGYQTTIF